ncbi:MAG: tRNA (adenosine(37)-N6)-threonylcarbamoyltransferase complex dimerization subunit type 1 TsaB [bacterium]
MSLAKSNKSAARILAIDTAQAETVIGLGDKIKSWISDRDQSKKLLPKIDQLLHRQKVTPKQLRGIVINLGPGSFTGLRVGATVANGFGYGLKIPVVGMSEFDIIRAVYPKTDLIVLDAKRGELFTQEKAKAPRLISIIRLTELIKKGSRVYIDDYRLIPQIHEYLTGAGTIYIPGLSRRDKLAVMLRTAGQRVSRLAGKQVGRAGEKTKKFALVMPLYLRGVNIAKPKR